MTGSRVHAIGLAWEVMEYFLTNLSPEKDWRCSAWPFAKRLLPWALGGRSLSEIRCFSGLLVKEMNVKLCFPFRHDTLRSGECCVYTVNQIHPRITEQQENL